MADRSIRIHMSANVAGLVNGFRTAGTAARNLNDRIVQNQAAVQSLTTGLGVIGAAGVAGAAVAIKTFASFDKTMSGVKATGEATATQLAQLREAAIRAGADTAFSAGEAAAGVENLLKAGVSAADVLGGGLTGALDLAAAGELGVADAAEIASIALTQFDLAGKDVTHVADLLAAGAGKAMGDVSDLAQALKQGGLVASQTGLTIEETTGTLSAFASAGLLGSDAGTSFKTMLQRLSNPTGEAAGLMQELGINAYDAQGNFVGMTAFAGQLTDALGDMTPAQRNAALATVFGSDAVRAAAVVYDQGESGIRDWINAVDDQGYAAEVAATRLDNLAGDLEELGGSFETAFIRAGSGGNDMVRGIVQGMTTAVNAIGSLDEGVLKTTTLIAGGGGLVLLGVAGLGKLVVGINNAKAAMAALSISTKGAALAAGAVGAAVAVAAVGLTVWATNAAEAQARTEGYIATLDELGARTDNTLTTINEALAANQNDGWLDGVFGKDPESLIDRAERVGLAVEDLQGYILGERDAIEKVTSATEKYMADQDGVMTKGERRKAASRFLIGALDQEAGSLTEAEKAAGQKAAADEAAGVAQEGLSDSYAATTGLIDEQVASLADLIAAQQEAAGVVLGQRDAQRAYQESLDSAREALKTNGEVLDVTRKKGRENSEALDGIAESALTVAASMEENGKSQEKIQGFIKRSRKSFVDMATDMGLSEKKAKDLADSLGLVPGNYVADTEVNTAAAEKALANLVAKIASADGTIEIKGDDAPAKRRLEGVTAEVNDADGTVTIKGDDGRALLTLDDFTAKVNESDGTVTIKGKDKQGRDTVVTLTNWIDEQGGKVKVDADTDGAKKKIDAVRKQILNLPDGKVTVTTDTRVIGPGMTGGGLPWGDGEGAGWSGSTPRGVSQMSSAVQSMDPGARVTSGYRPGAITATGYPSYHGLGRAIDIVSPNMGRTWDILARAFGSRAKELYYTPRGFIRNGRMTNDVAAVTRRQHYSHVHLALAQGGRLPGVAPANPRKDNLLGVDEHGTPLARIRSREWVVNQPASDYYGDGIMSALNSRQIPREMLEHLPGLAGGGAVGAAKGDLKRARRALDRARKARRDAKGDKARDRAQKAVDKAEARVDDERERLSRLRDERGDLRVDRRRGNIRDSATSGLSGAYGVADEMLALADSGDLGKRRSNRLEKRAKKAEKAMRGLYKQAERLDTRLEKAKAKLEDIASIKANVGSALASEQSLSEYVQSGAFRDVTRTNSRGETWTESVWDKGGAGTAKGLVAGAKATAARLKKFSNKLGKLRRLGLSKTILEEIAEAGSEDGMALADAFLADRGQIKGINAAYKDIAKHSNSAGKQVAESFGLSAAQSLVKGLERQESKVGRQIERWGVRMANGLIGALGGKKIKARANGGPVSAGTGYLVGEEGPELIVPSKSGYVMTAEQTRRLASTAHTVRRSDVAHQSGSSVTVNVAKVVAADTQAAVDRMYTKSWDAINANNVVALSQGVGV